MNDEEPNWEMLYYAAADTVTLLRNGLHIFCTQINSNGAWDIIEIQEDPELHAELYAMFPGVVPEP